MSRITSHPLGGGRTRIVHEASGDVIGSDMSPEYGGGGTTFSSTDLVAAALASCIGTSVEPLVSRHGVDGTAVEIVVDKEVSIDPKRISRLEVTIVVPGAADDRLAVMIQRAALTCSVHHSLHPEIASPVTVRFLG